MRACVCVVTAHYRQVNAIVYTAYYSFGILSPLVGMFMFYGHNISAKTRFAELPLTIYVEKPATENMFSDSTTRTSYVYL